MQTLEKGAANHLFKNYLLFQKIQSLCDPVYHNFNASATKKSWPQKRFGFKILSEKKMDDTFKIFVLRLKEGHQEHLREELSPEFVDIQESDVKFQVPVRVEGLASLSDDTFLLKLHVETEVTLPCAICNQPVQVPLSIPDFLFTAPLSEVRGGVFDYRDTLREAILLEIPPRAECGGGDCPERAVLAQYLKLNQE